MVSSMWTILIIVGIGTAVLALAALAGTTMLVRLTAQGGTSNADAGRIAAQTLAWSDAYRGASPRDHPPMDGSIELAPPVQDGSGGGV